jgi:membrane-associated HD superfamily phosphohydrolase
MFWNIIPNYKNIQVKKILNISFLRKIALILVLTGAVVSLILTFHTGRKNNALILTLLFAVWVLSPYIAFLMSDVISKSWSVLCRSALYCLMVVLTLVSLLFYSGILRLPRVKPAFVFIVVPLISWILLVILIPLNERLSGRMSNNNS